MSFPVGRYSTRSTRRSSTRRSTKPALMSCRARERLPMVRKGMSLSAFIFRISSIHRPRREVDQKTRQRSGGLVCVAFLTSSADEVRIQRSFTDCRVDLHLGTRDVLVHPRIGALLRLKAVL
jgi:hypothetical protein